MNVTKLFVILAPLLLITSCYVEPDPDPSPDSQDGVVSKSGYQVYTVKEGVELEEGREIIFPVGQ